MRVIGGDLRGRALSVAQDAGVRPTSDRTREAVFNVLMHRFQGRSLQMVGATVLDAFAGSGALGIEALSRGAAEAIFMDIGVEARAVLTRNLKTLGLQTRAKALAADATRPPPTTKAVDLAFLDPPYDAGLLGPALTALHAAGWVAEETLCVIERRSGTPLVLPEGYTVLDERRYGQAAVAFVRYTRL